MAYLRRMVRLASIKRWIAALIVASILLSGFIFVYKPITKSKFTDEVLEITKLDTSGLLSLHEDSTRAADTSNTVSSKIPVFDVNTAELNSEIARAVLIFTEFQDSVRLKKLKNILVSQKISFDVITWNRLEDPFLSPPRLKGSNGLPRYAGFIFDNSKIYLEMDQYNKGLLHNYCQTNNLGLILLAWNSEHQKETGYIQYGDNPIWIKYGVRGLYNTELNPQSSILQITKAGRVLECGVHRERHSVFWLNHSTYEPVSYAFRDIPNNSQDWENADALFKHSQSSGYQVNRSKFITIVHDKGHYDGIKKVFFGAEIHSLWQYKILFSDALSVLSKGSLGRPLTRWMLVDIDDIFVAHKGVRMKQHDVHVSIFIKLSGLLRSDPGW